jgi:predicted amidohydrolase
MQDRPPLRVAAAQGRALPGDVPENVSNAARLVRYASAAGADVVVLPELFLSGHDLDLVLRDPSACAIIPGDPRLEDLQAACYATRSVAVIGACVRRTEGHTASLVVVGRDGETHVCYDQQHLDADRRAVFTPGAHGCTLEIGGWRLGLGAHHDVSFPEHVRAAALDGCDAYLCAGLSTEGDAAHRRDVYLAARALENTCWMVAANHIGPTARGRACGRSVVFGPDGRRVAEADPDGVDVALATLEDIEVRFARECLTMLADLPPALAEAWWAPRETLKLD